MVNPDHVRDAILGAVELPSKRAALLIAFLAALADGDDPHAILVIMQRYAIEDGDDDLAAKIARAIAGQTTGTAVPGA